MSGLHTGQVVWHADFGTGRVVNVEGGRVTVNFIKAGPRFFSYDEADEALSDSPPPGMEKKEEAVDADELKEAIREVLKEEGLVGTTRMGEKWDGGELLMRPGKPGLQEKSVPIDTFFHKIVMIRNQLRLLEQNINNSKGLTEADKVDIQQYITRCYGSLTTFNALFADKKDWFVGTKKEDSE